MARFYGTIQGARGPASRLGHTRSGLRVTAQSYNGDVEVHLGAGKDDSDCAGIMVCAHGGGQSFCLYHGDVAALRTQEGQKAWIMELVRRHHLRDEIIHEFAEEALRQRAEGA